MNKQINILLFSVALNGFQFRYKNNIKSHQRYAQRFGYDYQCVQKPTATSLGIECAWLKVSLMCQALSSKYDWVIFLDADTYVQHWAPCVTMLEKCDKSLYVVKGYSERLNSGVLIVRNDQAVRQYFETTLAHADAPIPLEDQVGWGENGHLIHFARNRSFVEYLDSRWNNNADPDQFDFIRHFSYGPLADHYVASPWDELRYGIVHYYLACLKRTQSILTRIALHKNRSLREQIERLTERVLPYYPAFGQRSNRIIG